MRGCTPMTLLNSEVTGENLTNLIHIVARSSSWNLLQEAQLLLGWPTVLFPIHSFRQFFARTYRFATIQNVTDRQTDRRQTDDTVYQRLDR